MSIKMGAVLKKKGKVKVSYFCVFCYQSVPPKPAEDDQEEEGNFNSGSDIQLQRFLEELEDFVGRRQVTDSWRHGGDRDLSVFVESNEWLGCCENCEVIVDSFREVYQQLKCLEGKLEEKVGSMVEIMETANRTPLKMRPLNRDFQKASSGGEKKDVDLDRFKNSRSFLIQKCARRICKTVTSTKNTCISGIGDGSQTFISNLSGCSPEKLEDLELDVVMKEEQEEDGDSAVLDTNEDANSAVERDSEDDQRSEEEGSQSSLSDSDPSSKTKGDSTPPSRKKTNRVKNWQCSNCPAKFPFRCILKKHVSTYHNTVGLNPSQLHACDLCSASFLQSQQLSSHKFQHHYHQKCPRCGKRLPRPCKLWSHMEICTKKQPTRPNKLEPEMEGVPRRPCKICGESVPRAQMLEHVQSHVGSYAQPCPGCSLVAPCSSALRSHLKSIPRCREKAGGLPQTFVCDTCNFTTDHIHTFRCHLNRSHERGSEKTEVCPVARCDARFCVRQSVDVHLEAHVLKQTLPQPCPVCPGQTKPKGQMEDHLRTAHDAPEILKCGHCHFVFSSRVDLIEHQYAHRIKGMYCDLCQDGVKFPRHTELCDHYETVHAIPCKKYSCDQCAQKFGNRTAWHAHQKEKHSSAPKKATVKKKKWSCDLCLEVTAFTTEAYLISHKIRVHSVGNPFPCPTCGKNFNSNNVLKAHMKQKHSVLPEATEWKCEETGCGQIFSHKSTLTKHKVKVHGALKPYICDSCGKSYSHSEGLKEHKQAVHLGLRPYVCEICGEAFGTGTVLKRHRLIHSGDRPYECHLCHQRFRQKNVLQTHLEAHEKKGPGFRPTGPMKHIRKRKTTTPL